MIIHHFINILSCFADKTHFKVFENNKYLLCKIKTEFNNESALIIDADLPINKSLNASRRACINYAWSPHQNPWFSTMENLLILAAIRFLNWIHLICETTFNPILSAYWAEWYCNFWCLFKDIYRQVRVWCNYCFLTFQAFASR